MSRGKIDLSVEDVIATLRNSYLPTVVVEGSDDLIILRRLQEIHSDEFLSILSVGGRDKVIKAFDSRHLYPSETKFAFVADKDLWVISSIPNQYMNEVMILSNGYSIENDVISDGKLLALLTREEAAKFRSEVADICEWFAYSVHQIWSGIDCNLKLHASHILENGSMVTDAKVFIASNADARELRDLISANWMQMLRGKCLMAVLMRHLSYAGRPAKHHHASLLDNVGARPGPIISELFSRVSTALSLNLQPPPRAQDGL